MTSFPSLLHPQCTSSTELSPSKQMAMDFRMIWEGREEEKKQNKPKHPLSALPSLHTVFHHTILHLNMTVVFLGVSALLPSHLVAFFHRFGMKSPTLSPVSAPHVLWKEAASGVKEEVRNKEREGRREREKIVVTWGTQGARPYEQSHRRKCTENVYREMGGSPSYPRCTKACS